MGATSLLNVGVFLSGAFWSGEAAAKITLQALKRMAVFRNDNEAPRLFHYTRRSAPRFEIIALP
jgi:hypothetical protein